MPGRNPNPKPKPAATSVKKKANQKPKTTKGAKEKGKGKYINLRDVDLCKLWGWGSDDSFVKPKPDPKPEKRDGDEVLRSILGWDKDIWDKEMEIQKGMKVKDGKDLYYDDDEWLEFDKRMAQYFNWTDKDWEKANRMRELEKECYGGLDCDTVRSSFCGPECIGRFTGKEEYSDVESDEE